MAVDPQLKEIQSTNKKLDEIISTLNKGTLADMKKITEIINKQGEQDDIETEIIKDVHSRFGMVIAGAKQIFSGAAIGVKNMGKNFVGYIKGLKNSNNIIGKTFRFGVSLWQETHKNINKLFGKLLGHIQDVLGPVYDLFNYAWETVTSIFQSMKNIFFSNVNKKYQKDSIKYQKEIAKNTKKPGVGVAGKAKGEGESPWTILAVLAASAAIALGGIFKKIILPFQILWTALTAIPFIGKLISGAGRKIFGPVMEWVGKIIVWFEQIPFIGKFIGKFFKFFKLGMKILGWPLQIIMSVIDFIKGFMETEGSIVDKIFGGLQKVVLEFLDLPIEALGWVIEKIAGFFGIEIKGAADTIRGWIKSLFTGIRWAFNNLLVVITWLKDMVVASATFYYDNIITPIWNALKWVGTFIYDNVLGPIIEGVKGAFTWLSEFLSPAIEWIGNAFSKLSEWYENYIKGPAVKILKWLGFDAESTTPKEEPPKEPLPETPADEVQRKKNQSLEQSEEREAQRSADMKAAADAAQAAAEAAAKAAAAATQVSASNTNINKGGGGGGGDSKQTPDEIDSALGMHNLAMEFNF
jgi:hypothetical protein